MTWNINKAHLQRVRRGGIEWHVAAYIINSPCGITLRAVMSMKNILHEWKLGFATVFNTKIMLPFECDVASDNMINPICNSLHFKTV